MRTSVASFALATFVICLCGGVDSRAEDTPGAAGPIIACEGNQKNLQTYLQIHKVLFMDRDSSRVAEFYAEGVISHNQDTGGSHITKVKTSQLAAMWAASKKNNPDRVLDDNLIICSGDFVTVRTTVHNADLTGVEGNPATGKPYVISAIDIFRFKDGKVVERWGDSDLVSMYRQIGYRFTPPEKTTESKTAEPKTAKPPR